MTLNEFEKYFDMLIQEEKELIQRKGQEYSGLEDRYASFKRIGKQLGLPPEKILWVYLGKHLDGILSFINGSYTGTEPIRGRINDARNYLALLAGLIEEKMEKEREMREIIGARSLGITAEWIEMDK